MQQYVQMLLEGCNLRSAGSEILGKSGGLREDDCLKKHHQNQMSGQGKAIRVRAGIVMDGRG